MCSSDFDSDLMLSVETTLNLCATGVAYEILEAIPVPVSISAIVYSGEITGVEFKLSEQRIPALAIVSSLVDSGNLMVVKPQSDAEWETFFRYSRDRTLDNSEAALRAIVLHRNWIAACDDQITIKFFAGQKPPINTISSIDLIKFWSDITSVEHSVLAGALDRAHLNAHLEPKTDHPLYDWWRANSSKPPN
jgi:hypothetical protein